MKTVKHHIAYGLRSFAKNKNTANQPAITILNHDDSESSLSFKEWDDLSDSLAFDLPKSWSKKTPVLIHLENNLLFPIAYMACLKRSFLPLAINTKIPYKKLIELASQLKTDKIITSKNLNKKKFKFLIRLKKTSQIQPKSNSFKISPVNKNDPAFLMTTSGTSGEQKIVVHTHRAIYSHKKRTHLWLQVTQGSKTLSTSGLSWSYALVASLLDLSIIGTHQFFFENTPTPEKIIKTIQEKDIDCLMSVPTFYRRLTRLKDCYTLKNLSSAVSAGEKLSKKIKDDWFQQTQIPLQEGLGMTENSIHLIQTPQQAKSAEGIGQPLFARHTKLSKKTEGEILIHRNHPGLMLGYGHFSQKKLSWTLPLKNNFFHTSDLGKINSKDHQWHFLGRQDDMILTGGFKISPIEIENLTLLIPEIIRSCAFERHKKNKTYLALGLQIQKGTSKNQIKIEWQKISSQHLEHYKKPREIYFLNEFPLTSSGKIKRQQMNSVCNNPKLAK